MRRILAALVLTLFAAPAYAETLAEIDTKVRKILSKQFHPKDLDYLALHFTSVLMTNGGSLDNETNNALTFKENSEDLTLTFGTDTATFGSGTGATFILTPATTVTGDLTLDGAAGALRLTTASSSILVTDNSTTGLDIGSTGATSLMRLVTTDDAEYVQIQSLAGASTAIVGASVTLDASDCGKWHTVSAAFDTFLITLPILTAAPTGCEFKFHYIGADGGALLDITPNAADGIEGSCTLAASVVEFDGVDGTDVGLTKATIKKGDTMIITDVGDADDWYASGIQGICANN